MPTMDEGTLNSLSAGLAGLYPVLLSPAELEFVVKGKRHFVLLSMDEMQAVFRNRGLQESGQPGDWSMFLEESRKPRGVSDLVQDLIRGVSGAVGASGATSGGVPLHPNDSHSHHLSPIASRGGGAPGSGGGGGHGGGGGGGGGGGMNHSMSARRRSEIALSPPRHAGLRHTVNPASPAAPPPVVIRTSESRAISRPQSEAFRSLEARRHPSPSSPAAAIRARHRHCPSPEREGVVNDFDDIKVRTSLTQSPLTSKKDLNWKFNKASLKKRPNEMVATTKRASQRHPTQVDWEMSLRLPPDNDPYGLSTLRTSYAPRDDSYLYDD